MQIIFRFKTKKPRDPNVYYIEHFAIYELDRKDGIVVWKYVGWAKGEDLHVFTIDESFGSMKYPEYIKFEDHHLEDSPC